MWIVAIVSLLGLASCGSSKGEPEELMTKILNLVGIPQEMVVNICQDSNRDGFCNSIEIKTKIIVSQQDRAEDILRKIAKLDDGKYLLESFDVGLPIIMELEDKERVKSNDGRFSIPFNGFESKENNETKELSILQSMIDAEYLTPKDVNAVRSLKNPTIFYDTLLEDFTTNINTLTEKDISTSRAVVVNIKETAKELLNNNIQDELVKQIQSCEDNDSCVKSILEEVSKDVLITEEEANQIKENETKATKAVLSNKTFYLVNRNKNKNKRAYKELDRIEKFTFNSEVTLLSWLIIEGVDKGKSGHSQVEIIGNKIISDIFTGLYEAGQDGTAIYRDASGVILHFYSDENQAREVIKEPIDRSTN